MRFNQKLNIGREADCSSKERRPGLFQKKDQVDFVAMKKIWSRLCSFPDVRRSWDSKVVWWKKEEKNR